MSELLPDGYEPTEEWVNYGDVNPRRHGGRFLRWDGGQWELVETLHPKDVGADTDGRYVVHVYSVDPRDVFRQPGAWSIHATVEIDSLGNLPDADHYPPAGAVADDRLDYIVAGMSHRVEMATDYLIPGGEYWDVLADRHGIDPDEYRD